MNVNEVKNAQKIIRNAKNELAIIVKDFFESVHPIMVNDLQTLSIEDSEKATSLYTTIRKNGVVIMVNILCRNPLDCIYTISCSELGIFNYFPGTDNSLTAQGEAEICYYIIPEGETKKEPIIEKIRFRNYNVN